MGEREGRIMVAADIASKTSVLLTGGVTAHLSGKALQPFVQMDSVGSKRGRVIYTESLVKRKMHLH